MSDNGRKPRLVSLRCAPNAEGTYLRETQGFVEYDTAGIPVVLHIRCRNRECCPRTPGYHSYHLYTLWGVQNGVGIGRYVAVQVPLRDAGELPVGARKVT